MARYWIGFAALVVACGPIWAEEVERFPEGLFHLESKTSKKLSIMIELDVPPMTGSVLYPLPPNTPSQKVVHAEMALELGKGKVKGVKGADQGPFKKPYLAAAVNSAKPFKASAKFDIDFQQAKLAPGKAAKPVAKLGKNEKALYTQVEPNYEYDNATFKSWMKRSGLVRKKGERDIDFAFRVLGHIRGNFKYDFPPPKVLKAKVDALGLGEMGYFVTEQKGECWALSRVYTCVLRANGVPCRQISGRLLDKGVHHVRAEVHFEGIGWIHADPAAVVSFVKAPLAEYFGNGGDYMFVLNPGINFILPGPRGPGTIGTFSGFFLSRASGDLDSFAGSWKITPREK